MSDLIPFGSGGSMLTREARRAGRTISRISGRRAVDQSLVDAETDLTLTKTDSITSVVGSMMADVTRVAQAQRQLELLAPEASGRLAMIADGHALDLMEQAAEHRHALRRI